MNDRDSPIQPTGFDSPPASDSARTTDTLTPAGFQPLESPPRSRRGPVTPGRALGLLAAIVAALLLFFLLTARSLEIAVNTETRAEIAVGGLAIPVGNRWLLRPGDYPVTVTAEGYTPWRDIVTVGKQDSQRLEVSPAILPGIVDITSVPLGAEVVLGDQSLGTTPLRGLSLDAGETTLSLRLPRYQALSPVVTIIGREVAQTLAFQLEPDWAEVSLETTPADAVVTLDEAAVEQMPDQPLEILSGQHQLTVSAPGYQSESRTLEITAGVPLDLGHITLTPSDGVLVLRSVPAGANVTVDGEFRGQTPIELELAPDRDHRISLARPGYYRTTTRARLAQGSSEEQTVRLKPRLGDVAFRIEPAEAELLIDGKPAGRGSQTLALTAIEHRIEVRLDGYASYRGKVLPREGLAQSLAVTLITDAEARRAAMQPEITTALGQTLVLIDPVSEPVNSFTLGAPRRDPGRRSNETLRAVRLERAFYIATTETTNAQFRQFLASHDSGQIQGNSLNREHQPVVTISWQQAARFCNWLSDKEGLPRFYTEDQGIVTGFTPSSTGYRLPSEAEWAYAARVDGDTIRRFAWGDTFPPEAPVTNVADNTSAFVTGRILNGYADGHIVAAPVGSYPANHRGLFDMGGNVAEWVHDVYSIPAPSTEELVDPLGAAKGDNYTIRGASWGLSRLSELRLTFRDYGASGRDDLGFRITRYAE